MKKEQNYLNVLIILTISLFFQGCDPDYPPPKVEHCVIGIQLDSEGDVVLKRNGNGKLIAQVTCVCSDRRVGTGSKIYPISHCKNYLATSPRDYGIVEDWIDERIKELKECLDNKTLYYEYRL